MIVQWKPVFFVSLHFSLSNAQRYEYLSVCNWMHRNYGACTLNRTWEMIIIGSDNHYDAAISQNRSHINNTRHRFRSNESKKKNNRQICWSNENAITVCSEFRCENQGLGDRRLILPAGKVIRLLICLHFPTHRAHTGQRNSWYIFSYCMSAAIVQARLAAIRPTNQHNALKKSDAIETTKRVI